MSSLESGINFDPLENFFEKQIEAFVKDKAGIVKK